MKAAANIHWTHNPYEESHWVSRLRENFTSGSDGEGLETNLKMISRQSFTRQEDYKTMKHWIEIENFSGKSVLSIYQDFHAKIFSKNLTSALIFPTQKEIDQNTKDYSYRYKKNFAQTLSKVKDVIPLLFLRPHDSLCKLISDFHKIIVRTIEPIRPGRRYPRNFNKRSGRFHYGYQPIR